MKEYTVTLTYNSFAGYAKVSFIHIQKDDKPETCSRIKQWYATIARLYLKGLEKDLGLPTKVTLRERK